MAKLPTFEAKKVGGASAAPEMRANQRMMTKPFRKSTNINSSDFYNSAGTAAMGQVINNAINLYGHVKQKQKQAELETIRAERNSAFSLFTEKLNQSNTGDEDIQANDFVKKNEKNFTNSNDKRMNQKLKNEYLQLSTNLKINAIKRADKNSTEKGLLAYSNNLEKMKLDLAGDPTLIESYLTKARANITELLNSGIINNEEEAKEILRIANNQLHDASLKSMVNKSNTIDKLNEMQEPLKLSYTNGDITNNQYSVINKQIDSRKSEIIKENKEEFYDTFDDVRDLADKGEEFPEELIENFIILFGQNEFNKMLETQEDVSLLNEDKAEKQKNYNILFNQAKKIIDSAIMESLSMTDEASKDFMDGFSAKIKLDFPQLNKEDIDNLFKSNTLIRDSFYKQMAVTTASEAVNKGFLENKTKDSIKEDLIAKVPAKYIDVSIEQVEKIYDDLKKDFSATYGSRIAKVDFNKFLNTFAQGLAVKDGNITKQSFNKYASNIESNVGYTTDYLTNSQIGQIKDIIDGSFNNPKELIDTVKFIEDFAGDRFNVVADQIADAFGDEEGHIAASLSAIQENLEFGNKQIGNIIHKGSVMYDDVRKGEHKIDFKENFDAVLSSDYYSIYRGNDRVQLAKRIFASVGELDNYSKLSAKQSFDLAFKGMKIIDTGDVKMKIPSKVTNSKGGRDNVDVEKVQESINKITNHLLSNLEMYISVEEIADITNQMPALESSNNITDEIQIEESLGNITKKRRGNREQLAFKQSVKESIVNSLGPDGIMFEWVGENKIAVGYQPDVTSNMQLFKKNGKDFILDLSRMNTETVPKAPARGSYRTTYPKRFSQYIDNITE